MKQLAAGDRLGRYEILRRLGAGAMGEVYLAEDPQIGRRVAIKTVRVEEGKAQEMEERKRRLLREARAAGRLLHPHIVALFDAGEDQGLLYLAFEWVDGCDLAERLTQGEPLTLREAIEIVRQAADGLDYAHRQGIVHRDIKPSNLLLGAGGQVKISDFGIAKLADQTSDLTMTGSVVGSPHYLSPEQIRGDELDGRSDLFSLGVLFYEVLSRRRPFEGETLTTLVYQILHRDPPSLVGGRPGLGTRLESVLERMLHKERDQRFPTAGELARELGDCLRDLPASLLDAPAAEAGTAGDGTRRLDSAERATPLAQTGATPPPPPAPRAAAAMPPPPPPASPTQIPTRLVPPRASAPASKSGLWLALAAGLVVVAALVAGGFAARRWVAAKEAQKQPATTATDDKTTPAEASIVPKSSTPARAEPSPPASDQAPSQPADTKPANQEPAIGERFAQRPAPQPPPEPRPRQPSEESPAENAAPVRRPESRTVAPAPEPATSAAPAETTATDEGSPPLVDRPALSPRIDRRMVTGMSLSFVVEPPESIVKIDNRVIGQAGTWQVKKREGRAYDLPEPGEHLVRIIHPVTNRIYVIHVTASLDAPTPTVISVDLRPGADQGKKPRRFGGRDRDGG